MRTFIFNLTLFCFCLVAMVFLLRPMVAAYHLATQPLTSAAQPSVATPQQPPIEYGTDYFVDFEFMPPGLNQLPLIVN